MIKEAIKELLKLKINSHSDLMAAKRKMARKYKIKIPLNSDILSIYQKMVASGKTEASPKLKRVLRKRAVRTLSGIAPVAVLVRPYPCPGKCVYCPREKDVPPSYLSNEPAVMRAIRCGYNPYMQVQYRLRALEANGHEPNKIELIVIGGTWSVLPRKYKYWFVKECFRGANNFPKMQNVKIKMKNDNLKLKIDKLKRELNKDQKRNEKAKYRLIGITLETRPDYIKEKELWEMRELGCTRVELGIQAIDDQILKLNKRGHGVEEIATASKLLKDFGFKVTYHIMPGLPGSTPAKDYKMYQQLFTDERFQPDQIKFYPTVVTKGSLLYNWWKLGKYKPYSSKALQNLIIKCKAVTPSYVRIIRLIRDIPSESIIAGNKVTNLRQVMQAKGIKCRCIRCREVRDEELRIKNYELKIKNYNASAGKEYFLSYESKDGKTLYGFCRLRLPSVAVLPFNKKTAIIRELHIYGELVPVGPSTSSGQVKKVQHAGLGKKLMAEAEKITLENGFERMIVIAGVGVRDYYRKLGYKLQKSYMVKKLS